MISDRWNRGARRRVAAFGVSAMILLLGGCGPVATFRVLQPRLTGRQQDMTLTSSSAEYGQAEDRGGWHILVRFPLPGAMSGRPNYLVYLHVPDPGSQESVTFPLGETATARGFFVQKAGEGRGRELMVGGFVVLSRLSGGRWLLQLTADGAMGTQILGTATLTRRDLDVRDYIERHHPGDVADLLAPPVSTRKA
ncbi:MAG: hypothetical protein ACPMAQ_19280, partial [Phycisphaerae bacterium]